MYSGSRLIYNTAKLFTATYVCSRTKVAHANALPAHIRDQLARRNEEDHKLVIREQIESIKNWCDQRYKHIVEELKSNTEIIDTLDYIRVVYSKPLNPSQKMRVRGNITKLLEIENLTQNQVDFLLSILEYYECM